VTIKELRNTVERKRGQKERIESDLQAIDVRLQQNEQKLSDHEKAREIIREVGLKTQQELSYNISEITSMALDGVFDDPYELLVEFVQRRNKTECDLWFKKDGEKIYPLYAGGGALDVAAFALRVASWSMQQPRTRNVLIGDESFKHLKGEEANRRVLEMVREVAEKMNLQIILVSDERVSREAIMDNTDRLFEVSIENGVSNVETLK
jgi:DNA repair exonuclease SbcCD ATPase subunit